jgi:hypothetical protein
MRFISSILCSKYFSRICAGLRCNHDLVECDSDECEAVCSSLAEVRAGGGAWGEAIAGRVEPSSLIISMVVSNCACGLEQGAREFSVRRRRRRESRGGHERPPLDQAEKTKP